MQSHGRNQMSTVFLQLKELMLCMAGLVFGKWNLCWPRNWRDRTSGWENCELVLVYLQCSGLHSWRRLRMQFRTTPWVFSLVIFSCNVLRIFYTGRTDRSRFVAWWPILLGKFPRFVLVIPNKRPIQWERQTPLPLWWQCGEVLCSFLWYHWLVTRTYIWFRLVLRITVTHDLPCMITITVISTRCNINILFRFIEVLLGLDHTLYRINNSDESFFLAVYLSTGTTVSVVILHIADTVSVVINYSSRVVRCLSIRVVWMAKLKTSKSHELTRQDSG